jgi:DNA-binding NarL/FixJ family response regulator
VSACRVLLCDDQPEFRALMRAVLEGERDVELVGEAGDGRECVQRAGELRPDLVLLDLNMPRMDGFEALPLLREAAPDTFVVVLTTARALDAEDQARALGAAGFVEKAGDVFDLPRAIRSQLRRAA